MKNKRAFFCALLSLCLLCGCGGAPAVQEPETPPTAQTVPETETPAPPTAEPESETEPDTSPAKEDAEVIYTENGFTDFDSSLIASIEAQGFDTKSYILSPLSFRAALALAAAGAEGETRAALLTAMGFESLDAVEDWYAAVKAGVAAFAAELEREAELSREYGDGTEPDGAYRVLNSLWLNSDGEGRFAEAYENYVQQTFDAMMGEAPGAELAGAVNAWAGEATEGLIPSVAGDLSQATAVLVNALYLRSAWVEAFSEELTAPGVFHTLAGGEAEMDFMHQQDLFAYYEDADSQLVVLPLKGGFRAVFVLGSAENLPDKLSRAEYKEVAVTLPKFEIESDFSQRELLRYLEERGAGIALSDGADFSAMCADVPWAIDDILQKARIKVDEEGLEAAAVTAIMMEGTAYMPPEDPAEFTADRPFRFYLCTEGETPELLFCGQYVG